MNYNKLCAALFGDNNDFKQLYTWQEKSSTPDFHELLKALCLFSPHTYYDFLLSNLRPSLSICVQQHTVRDVLNMALLFLQLCPEESRAVQVPVLVLIKPHSTSPAVSFKASDAGQWIAVVHETRRRWDLIVLWCARWVGHVGLGAGDDLIRFITVVPCTLMRRNDMEWCKLSSTYLSTLRSSYIKWPPCITSWRPLRWHRRVGRGQRLRRGMEAAASSEVLLQHLNNDCQFLQAFSSMFSLKAKCRDAELFKYLLKLPCDFQHSFYLELGVLSMRGGSAF